MKFAHLGDSHIGGWREPKLRELGIKTFEKAIDICIKEHVAFLLISGDLFNTSLPSIDLIKETAAILQRLKENDINVYIIPGSHDFSPSNKTMLDVLEKAGLVENVAKFTDKGDKIDLSFTTDKTNIKITGIYGKRGGLDKFFYSKLNKKPLEEEIGFKIFMFHCGINEFLPKFLEKIDFEPLSSFPKNFNYYAGGHIHYRFSKEVPGYGFFAFPGPLFPNNFEELENLKCGTFNIININGESNVEVESVAIKLFDVVSFDINVAGLSAEEAQKHILRSINDDVDNKIVTLRISGILKSGKVRDIDLKEINYKLKNAYVILKNTYKLTTREYEALKIETGNLEDVESKIIREHLGFVKLADLDDGQEEKITKDLIHIFSIEKDEAEKTAGFESRILSNFIKTFMLQDFWKDDS